MTSKIKTFIFLTILNIFGLVITAHSADRGGSSGRSGGGGERKHHTVFLQGVYGNTIAADDEKNRPASFSSIEQSHDVGAGYQVAAGWRWKYMALEGIYGDFGKPKVTYKDTLTVEKSVRFFGGGFHWMLWFLDLRLGWATFRGSRKFTVNPLAASTLSVEPLDSKIASGGNYFGLGFNFNLGTNTEFVLDYTGYVFREKAVTYTINGVSETFPKADSSQTGDPNDDITGFVGIVGLGLRWFF